MEQYYVIKKKFIFVALFLIIIFFIPVINNLIKNRKVYDREYTNKQWIEDIKFMENIIIRDYPTKYDDKSIKAIGSKFEILKKNVSKLNDYEIALNAEQIIASLKDGHTHLNTNLFYSALQLPIKLQRYDNDIIVCATISKYKNILGTKLISINNIPIENIMDKIDSLVPMETAQYLRAEDCKYINREDVLKFFNIIKGESSEWTFLKDSGDVININIVPSEKDSNKDTTYIKDYISKIPITETKSKKNSEYYWYKYIPQDKILYFQYNECIDKASANLFGIKNSNLYPVFSEYVKGLEEEIKNNNVNKLIIDMRNNTGGNEMVIRPLINMILNNPIINQKGKLFVIIGNNTFSAAVINAYNFKTETNALLIGEPTGGSLCSFGDPNTVVLPNTKLTLQYSTSESNNIEYYGKSLTPDIVVVQSFEDYKKGIDDIYEAIKKYDCGTE